MLVREWMQPDPPTVRAEAQVAEAQRLAEEQDLAIVLVVDEEGRLSGFLTRKALAAAPDPSLPAGKLAATPTVTLAPDDPLERAVVLMERHLLLPVVDGEKLVGVLTRSGMLRALARMAGLGEEGTRIRICLSHPLEVYRALEVLSRHKLPLVAVIQGGEGEVVLHVRDVDDREGLQRELEEALRMRSSQWSD